MLVPFLHHTVRIVQFMIYFVITAYGNASDFTIKDCHTGKTSSCPVKLSRLGPCSGLSDKSYGYDSGSPCVLLKINKVSLTQSRFTQVSFVQFVGLHRAWNCSFREYLDWFHQSSKQDWLESISISKCLDVSTMYFHEFCFVCNTSEPSCSCINYLEVVI